MSDERIAAGVERIERALARIGAAAGRRPDAGNEELETLRARHAALRGEVAAAMRELDEVLAGG